MSTFDYEIKDKAFIYLKILLSIIRYRVFLIILNAVNRNHFGEHCI